MNLDQQNYIQWEKLFRAALHRITYGLVAWDDKGNDGYYTPQWLMENYCDWDYADAARDEAEEMLRYA